MQTVVFILHWLLLDLHYKLLIGQILVSKRREGVGGWLPLLTPARDDSWKGPAAFFLDETPPSSTVCVFSPLFVKRHHGAPSSPPLVNHINWFKSRITEEAQLVYSPKAIGFRSPRHYDAINIGNTVQHRFMGSDQEILIGVYWLVYFQQTPGGLEVARKYIKKAIKNGWLGGVKSIASHR